MNSLKKRFNYILRSIHIVNHARQKKLRTVVSLFLFS